MSFFIEFHLIQNFAPANLNRDDTGSPKDAIFGGQRRARVSSQCLKRSVREWFKSSNLLPGDTIGVRTRYLDRLLEEQLMAIGLKDSSVFNEIVKQALKKKKGKDEGEGKDSGDEDGKLLSYLLFISSPEVHAIRELIIQHSSDLLALASKKKLKPTDIPDSFREGLKQCLKKSRSADIALFGRMLADLPEVNQEAACQVAHAISTHRVEREFDYFTAVDDQGGPDETGAGMIGQVEFNSATFYRYAVVDARKLLANLQNDKELTLAALEAFAQAMARAIPTGKQNSFAAHNAPEFVGVSLRHGSPLNLANAFEKPVFPRQDQALTAQSVAAMAEYEGKLASIYADGKDRWAFLDLTGQWPQGKGEAQATLAALAGWVREQAAAALEA